jgi:deoxyadenosine/deoxycytidine kinase
MPDHILIGIVGPCAAGKSTLVSGLTEHGIAARHIAQEHSYVKNMWQRITNPDILIYLDVSFSESMQRRKMNWREAEFLVQVERLEHARQHAHIYINTNQLTPQQVLQQVLQYLEDNS